MPPEYWGKHLWFCIHIIALGYPVHPSEDDKATYKDFYENLWKVIPCYKCSVNYRRHLVELPIDEFLVSNQTLFAWTVALHNIVNKELNKPEMPLTTAQKLYTDPEFLANMSVYGKSIAKQTSFYMSKKDEVDKYTMILGWFVMGGIVGCVVLLVLLKTGVIKIKK